jgi:hypothetical protein
LCSPTGAALLTGRNRNRVGFGPIAELAKDWNGYNGIIPKSSAIVAEVRHDCSYATAAFGADHNTSVDALGNGLSHRFPIGRGFDYCYGFIAGVECDYIAVRAKEVDWQIWIAQGERPYPCRYSITTTVIDGSPQYTIDVRDWKTGDEVAAADFSFKNSTNASKVELEDLKGTDALPAHFVIGEAK